VPFLIDINRCICYNRCNMDELIKEVKAKADDKGQAYVELKLDSILCSEIELDDVKVSWAKRSW